jgi:hypothetical protein
MPSPPPPAVAARRAPPPPALAARRPVGPSCRARRDAATGTYVLTCLYPGQVKLTIALPEEQARRLAAVDLRSGGRGAVSGGIFEDIGRGFSKIIKNEVVQNVAAGALALYGVPPGVTKTGMSMAGNLAQKAAEGDPRAARRRAEIRARAARGEPAARRAEAALQSVERSRGQVRLSLSLLEAAARGEPRARARLLEISHRAAAGDRGAQRAARAIRVVLATGYRESQRPAVQPSRAAAFYAADARASVQQAAPRRSPMRRAAPPPPAVSARRALALANAAPPPPAVAVSGDAYRTAISF